MPQKTKILIGATGSVASIKIPILVQSLLQNQNVEIKIVSTDKALHFFDRESLTKDFGVQVITDTDEWKAWSKVSDPVLHIEYRNWADMFVIAPLDANTLAKVANGLCDNLITCILRAWDTNRPVIVCPAMNTYMWEHPFTLKHLEILTNQLKYEVISPISKKLACGDTGIGAMEEVATIVKYIQQKLFLTQ
ncbi:phosphopantothenoylcysteine decarboxylase-like protein [Glomus cerebriforme]|uniref:Phosphopantothenoylcysteine decarboxylase-like protein n=1 Tax=Glomus cerebriforme TaxID=658196 RepID=A0A397TRK9_9GLOM|nr:phosphopantothenoylcysteine decarboxylase-like protein [Glomus cerebriforme]